MSYVGNAWQAEAKNAITAMSKTAAYRDKVELRVQASGANAQRQIEQINGMIQAGADAIVAFPISPTALNGVIKTACEKKVVFVAVNGVTEPCAYNVKIDGVKHGAKQAKWVFEAIGGKGNVVYITGVPGVSYSEDYTKGVMDTAKEYPGVHITGTLVGMWDQSLARVKMKEFLATHTWDDIDGVIAATGCYTISQMQVEDGRWPGKPIIPCAGILKWRASADAAEGFRHRGRAGAQRVVDRFRSFRGALRIQDCHAGTCWRESDQTTYYEGVPVTRKRSSFAKPAPQRNSPRAATPSRPAQSRRITP